VATCTGGRPKKEYISRGPSIILLSALGSSPLSCSYPGQELYQLHTEKKDAERGKDGADKAEKRRGD
jgi:hypothetical protein